MLRIQTAAPSMIIPVSGCKVKVFHAVLFIVKLTIILTQFTENEMKTGLGEVDLTKDSFVSSVKTCNFPGEY